MCSVSSYLFLEHNQLFSYDTSADPQMRRQHAQNYDCVEAGAAALRDLGVENYKEM